MVYPELLVSSRYFAAFGMLFLRHLWWHLSGIGRSVLSILLMQGVFLTFAFGTGAISQSFFTHMFVWLVIFACHGLCVRFALV